MGISLFWLKQSKLSGTFRNFQVSRFTVTWRSSCGIAELFLKKRFMFTNAFQVNSELFQSNCSSDRHSSATPQHAQRTKLIHIIYIAENFKEFFAEILIFFDINWSYNSNLTWATKDLLLQACFEYRTNDF